MTKPVYYQFIFAQNGDVEAVPMQADPNDLVSVEQGYTPPYSIPYKSPGAQAINRTKLNKILQDLSSNIQAYQQLGTPYFISSDDNGGTPFAYSQYARCLYDMNDGKGLIPYVSLTNNNTDTPPSPNWQAQVSNSSASTADFPNSNFQIWQQGTAFGFGANNLPTNGQVADRMFMSVGTGSATVLAQDVRSNPYNQGSPYALQLTSNNVVQANFYLYRAIKGVGYMNGRVITYTAGVYNNSSAAFKTVFNFQQNFGSGGNPSPSVANTQSVTINPGYNLISLQINVAITSNKTIGTNGDDFVLISLIGGLTVTTIDITILFEKIDQSATPSGYLAKDFNTELLDCRGYYQGFVQPFQGKYERLPANGSNFYFKSLATPVLHNDFITNVNSKLLPSEKVLIASDPGLTQLNVITVTSNTGQIRTIAIDPTTINYGQTTFFFKNPGTTANDSFIEFYWAYLSGI